VPDDHISPLDVEELARSEIKKKFNLEKYYTHRNFQVASNYTKFTVGPFKGKNITKWLSQCAKGE
jgi:hypothetical protein